jgi:hypothetical protein
MESQVAITISLEVGVTADELGEATVILPPELRMTEAVVGKLHSAIRARELELKHWTVSNEQLKELESLSNVVIE